jgi:radical SAM protein with 4Fe4S-binding SPASM domain
MSKRFRKIYVEITNVCNLNCSFCVKTKRKPEFMSVELYKKIVKEAVPLTDQLCLHVLGEPLMHPEFDKLVRETKGISINLTTNGTLIAKHEDVLLNANVRRINFSLHGLLSNYTEDQQNKCLNEIIRFVKLANAKKPEMLISFRLWNVDSSTKDANQRLLDIIGREFGVKLENLDRSQSIKVTENTYVHFSQKFKWPELSDPVRTSNGYCHGLLNHIGILADGTVVPCCLDYNGTLALGNIKQTALNDIIQTEKAQKICNGFKTRKLVEELCKRCMFIEKFD